MPEQGGEMGIMKENPRYNVVSVRVSDEECELLHRIQKTTSKSISTIMREAIWQVMPQLKGGDGQFF